MKICYYNWIDFSDKLQNGGGVSIYQNNLINNSDNDCFFISSGTYYKPPFNKISYYIEDKKARIYNSPVLAPAHLSFGDNNQIESLELDNIFVDILNEFGDLDIIHFNNLEGISCSLLKLIKKKFPKVKIVLSMHNYYPFCSQVNLWYKENQSCGNFDNGEKCLDCVKIPHSQNTIKIIYFMKEILNKLKIKRELIFLKRSLKFFLKEYNNIKKFLKLHKSSNKLETKVNTKNQQSSFFYRRNTFIENINKYVDGILCVSYRVQEICISFGIKKEKCHTMYIGTEHAKYFKENNFHAEEEKKDNIFTIAYLGYMRKDKGFLFLLSALDKIDVNISRNIRLVIAAKKEDSAFTELTKISRKFYSLEYYDGYNHDTINDILKQVDLGIIPPLWEDNLPQVAIEMHCRRIPLLTSTAGGAKELHHNNPKFTFISGNIDSFKIHLENLFKKGIDKHQYFSNVLTPKTMQEHILELDQYYLEIIKNN